MYEWTCIESRNGMLNMHNKIYINIQISVIKTWNMQMWWRKFIVLLSMTLFFILGIHGSSNQLVLFQKETKCYSKTLHGLLTHKNDRIPINNKKLWNVIQVPQHLTHFFVFNLKLACVHLYKGWLDFFSALSLTPVHGSLRLTRVSC